jgi:hypothetical protein
MLSKYLHTVSLSVCLLLSACASVQQNSGKGEILDRDEDWCAPDDDGFIGCFHARKGVALCPRDKNVAQCYFLGAELVVGSKAQMRELLRALKDTLELSIEELREKRYAYYDLKQYKWTAPDIIGAYYNNL